MAGKTIDEIARLCADCGTCQSACPVYQAELSEPNSPRGKVNLAKALADGRLVPNSRNRRLLYQCLVCGGCESACPQGVEFTPMMIEHRNRFAGLFTYHDPCHNLKSLKLRKEMRHFLERFGERFVDDDSALCCGFGGIFTIGFPSTSRKILDRKSAKLAEIGAGAVVTSCHGCYLQLKENLPIPVYFFSDIFN